MAAQDKKNILFGVGICAIIIILFILSKHWEPSVPRLDGPPSESERIEKIRKGISGN